MPEQLIETTMVGVPAIGAANGRAERQVAQLAAAIREHEATIRGRPLGVRSPDANLYRRLRQICGER